jgi:hypothetical protein
VGRGAADRVVARDEQPGAKRDERGADRRRELAGELMAGV